MSGGTESVDAAASTEQGSLKTIWVKLERRRHADVSVLHARLHPAPDPGGPDYAAAFDSLYQVVRGSPCCSPAVWTVHSGCPDRARATEKLPAGPDRQSLTLYAKKAPLLAVRWLRG